MELKCRYVEAFFSNVNKKTLDLLEENKL